MHHRLLWNLLAPTLGEDIFFSYVEILNQCLVPTDAILKDSGSAWFRGRSRANLVAISLKETCAELKQAFGQNLEEWRWGRLHQLLMNHSLGRISLLQPLLAIGPIPAAGDGTTINLGFYRHSNPYRQTVGAPVIEPLRRPNRTVAPWEKNLFFIASSRVRANSPRAQAGLAPIALIVAYGY